MSKKLTTEQRKQRITEFLGSIINNMFKAKHKTITTMMKTDPRFKSGVQKMIDNMEDLDKYMEKQFGGTPEEIEAKAKKAGMSVENYLKIVGK